MKYTFPPEYAESSCYLVAINTSLLPLVVGALAHFEKRHVWHSDEEYEQGYNAFAELQACMTQLCIRELIDSNNRIYRLLDSSLNGVVYSASGTGTTIDPYLYEPPMPVVPATLPGLEPSLKFSSEKVLRLVDNLVNGTIYADVLDARNFRQQLDDLIAKATEEDSLDAEQLAELVQILAALL